MVHNKTENKPDSRLAGAHDQGADLEGSASRAPLGRQATGRNRNAVDRHQLPEKRRVMTSWIVPPVIIPIGILIPVVVITLLRAFG